jgi:predicted DNA-binding transcriptional regulator AlpA
VVRSLLAHQTQDSLVSWQDVQASTGLSRSRAYTLLREERARLAASNGHQPTPQAQRS